MRGRATFPVRSVRPLTPALSRKGEGVLSSPNENGAGIARAVSSFFSCDQYLRTTGGGAKATGSSFGPQQLGSPKFQRMPILKSWLSMVLAFSGA